MFTPNQQVALAIAPKFSATLSILSSLCIMKSVLGDMKIGNAETYHRLLFGMSAFDVVASFAQFLSTWPIPKGTPGVWGAVGNTTTCTFQGFIGVVSAGPLYNASLGVYYLLRCRYKWNEASLKKIERYMHAIPIVNAIGTAFASLPLKLFNNANLWCWIAPFPLDCKNSFRFGDEGNCVRGDNATIYRLAFLYVQVWLSILVAMISMILIYFTVLDHERKAGKAQESGIVTRKHSRRVANQAFWYMMAFYVVWGAPSILRLIQSLPGGSNVKAHFKLVFFMALFSPMQGLFTFLVFFRPRYEKYRRTHPQNSVVEAMRNAVFSWSSEESSWVDSATASSEGKMTNSPIQTSGNVRGFQLGLAL